MPSEPRTGQQLYHAGALAPVAAIKLVAAAIFALFGLQIVLHAAGLIEVAAALIADVLILLGLAVYGRRRRLEPAQFGVRRPALRHVLAGGLIGVSAWYLNLHIVALIDPPGDARSLHEIVERTPLPLALVAIAVMPAIAEEIVFRGVLARALATRLRPLAVIVLSSLVFALYHLLPAQMISTFGLGLALAFLTLRADSALPAMIAHLLNNAIAIVLARDELPELSAWMGANTPAMLIGSVVLLGAGIALSARGPA